MAKHITVTMSQLNHTVIAPPTNMEKHAKSNELAIEKIFKENEELDYSFLF